MNQPALKVVKAPAALRRFDTADLSVHAKWLVPRMIKAWPHFGEWQVGTFLQSILYNNEYRLLYQDTGVALAQVVSAHSLDAKPIVFERFVWVADPSNAQQKTDAAEFYVEFQRWAKGLAVDVMIVEENSDVPHELIKEKLGRVFTRQQQFVRI